MSEKRKKMSEAENHKFKAQKPEEEKNPREAPF